jgi:predicted Na+-dependent transporter
MDPLTLTGNVLLFLLVFGMSATVDIGSMNQQLRNKNAILLGIFCQFILLPFLGFVIVRIFQLDAAIGITLLVVTSSPGGSYSNWWVISERSLKIPKSICSTSCCS